MPVLPTFENLRRGAACAPGHTGGGEAVPRRALGDVRLGRPPRLQGSSDRRLERRTGGPEDIRPPATTSRARPQGAKIPRRPLRNGRPRRGSRRAVVEAAGSAPSDEAGAREPRGRHRPADPKIRFRRPLLAFFKAGVRLGRAPGVDSARPTVPQSIPVLWRCPCRQVPPRFAEVSSGRGDLCIRPSSYAVRLGYGAPPPRSRSHAFQAPPQNRPQRPCS